MARKFSFPTVQQLVDELREEGIPRFSRSTFYRMVIRYGWPMPKRTAGKWRRFEEDPKKVGSLEFYKNLVKKAYGVI